jgi:MTH538 TIR-like domain (DUF1863)
VARRVFFSFHYQKDIWRVNQVRRSGEFTEVEGSDTFYDNSLWEATKKKGEAALKKLIQDGLHNSSVTTALAAHETWKRPWVRYELIKSFERGNGLITLWIHNAKNQDQQTTTKGHDPYDCLWFELSVDGKTARTKYYDGANWFAYETISSVKLPKVAKDAKSGKLSKFAFVHTWTAANAKEFSEWAEEAAKAVGR